MDRLQASHFMHQLINLWEGRDSGEIPTLYHESFEGEHNGQSFDREELVQRFAYFQERYKNQLYDLKDFHVIEGNKLFSLLHILAVDTEKNQTVELRISHLFQIEAGKIVKLWSLTSDPLSIKSLESAAEDQTIENYTKNRFPQLLQLVHTYKELRIQLTAKEIDCLYYYISGLSAKETAPMLDMSYRTVEKHLENIKIKYKLRYKSELRQVFTLVEP